jgi:hypothetical protein
MVSNTPRPLYPRERPGTHCTGGWVGLRAGMDVSIYVHNKITKFLLQMFYRFLAIHNTFVEMHNFEKRFQS